MTEQEIERIFKLLTNTNLFEQVIESLNRYEIFQLIRKIDGEYVNGYYINNGRINDFIEQYMRSNNNINGESPEIIRNSIGRMEREINYLDYKRMHKLRNKALIRLADDHFIQTERHIEVFNKKRHERELQRNIFFDFKIIKNSTNLDLNEKLYTCSLFFDVLKITEGKVNIRDQYELTERSNINNFDFSRLEILQEMQNILGSYGVSQEYRTDLATKILQEEFPIEQTATTSSPDMLKKLMIQFNGKNIVQQAAENLSKQIVAEYIENLRLYGIYCKDEKSTRCSYIDRINKQKIFTVLEQEISKILPPDIQEKLIPQQTKESMTHNSEQQKDQSPTKRGFVSQDCIILNPTENAREGFVWFNYRKCNSLGWSCKGINIIRLIKNKTPGYLMYFEEFLNEEGKYCIRLIPCKLLPTLTKVYNFSQYSFNDLEDLKDLFLKKQSERPELYPTWKDLLNDETLFSQRQNKRLAKNKIIIDYPQHTYVSDDKKSAELIVNKLRAIYTARDVMDNIYRMRGSVINTLRPKSRFIVENIDLVDGNNGSCYTRSPDVDKMAKDYKESTNLFEESWRDDLFKEKQNVRNALCQEYELDEEDENNDIVIKFNDFGGETTYSEGFALVNGKLTYFEKLIGMESLSYRLIECQPKQIIITERQLEEFVKDLNCDIRMKNFTSYKDILGDGTYSQYLLAEPLSENQLEGHIKKVEIDQDVPANNIKVPVAGPSQKMTIQDDYLEQLKTYVEAERALIEKEEKEREEKKGENDSEISLD